MMVCYYVTTSAAWNERDRFVNNEVHPAILPPDPVVPQVALAETPEMIQSTANEHRVFWFWKVTGP